MFQCLVMYILAEIQFTMFTPRLAISYSATILRISHVCVAYEHLSMSRQAPLVCQLKVTAAACHVTVQLGGTSVYSGTTLLFKCGAFSLSRWRNLL